MIQYNGHIYIIIIFQIKQFNRYMIIIVFTKPPTDRHLNEIFVK
jgi:hypothetical protein